MGPSQALRTSLRNTFRFSGRATRSEFWWSWAVFYGFAMLALLWRGLPATGPQTDAYLTLFLFALALPMMSVGTRRLADAGVWRWLFVITLLLGWAQQGIYMLGMPSLSDLYAMSFQAERNDVSLPLGGYEINHILRALRDDVLPWTGRILAALCLILAALPSRGTARQTVLNAPEVHP
jgi:uncharacterized membrane protein YhaH (DUF805 family)